MKVMRFSKHLWGALTVLLLLVEALPKRPLPVTAGEEYGFEPADVAKGVR